MTYTVLGTDDEALRITVTDALGYAVSVLDNDTEYGTTITDDTQNNLQLIALTTTSAYTDQDARDSISVAGDLAYNNSTGVISYTEPTTVSTFTNDADYATQTDVTTAVNNLIDSAPGALDTLNELAAAINDDADAYTTLNDLITANATNIALKFNTSDFNSTFDTRLATKSTTNLSEGSNLYHTTSRTQAVIDTNTAGFISDYTVTQSDVTGHQAALSITESQISDLQAYITSYTVTQSDVTAHQAALSITESQISDLQSYITDYTVTESDVTAHQAALSITESQISDLDKYTDADFDTRLGSKTTANLTEGSNLYYTNARADARIAAADTDDLSEGSSNQYFTAARANSAIDTRVTGSFIDALDTVSDGGSY